MKVKTCKECGAELSASAKICPKCGKDQRNFFMKHPILYSVLILIVLGGVIGSSGDKPAKSDESEIIYNIGDTITTDTLEIVIEDVHTATKVGGEFFQSTPSEGGIYVCVDISYKNISSKPVKSGGYPSLKLIDGNGVEYSRDIEASSNYATEKNPDRKVFSELNPGITVRDNDAFEIGEESYNEGEWYVLIGNNTKVKIK